MFTRIHHVAIAVRDIDSALCFYRDILGLAVGERATVADQGVHAALLPLQEGEIELLEPANPTGGVARFLERRGEGPHHLCLETPDISGALEHATAANIPLIDQTARPGLAGMIGFLHPKACHGVLVEMAQPRGHRKETGSSLRGVQAVGIDTAYVAVKEIEAAAATLTRNFGGRFTPTQDDGRLDARQIVIWIGKGRITLVSPRDPADSTGVARFLVDRGEGLYGVCLRVRELRGALQHLAGAGIGVDVKEAETTFPLVRLPADRAHGLQLFLCQGSPNG